ncbi:DUF397 domain-containing protein [Streptomyces sp. RKND-216]|uniref:DUF397 domain-containing protein n=1 Tax=Streptomyces sp. RKND-216 TaxID=2562581 RepID=UPI00109DDCD4|nr:DUF397 domain-containing protein [Streptomyces sp. RKND-216]THA25595.1 DUF397 domain-containing protein [Streptomyces sp. RKND-216]
MHLDWHKSSYSEDSDGNCLEVARHEDGLLIRESDDPDVIADLGTAAARAFLGYVRHMPLHSSK